jgi:hypothetical protein
MFLDSSRMEEIRNLQARSLGQVTPGQSRILKRNQTMDEKYLMPKEEAMAGRGVSLGLRPPTISSKTRASEALRKLAQIETKILNRKQVPMAWSDVESDSTSIEQSLPKRTGAASVSSQYPHRTFQKQVNKTCVSKSDGPSGNGSRFLKKKELPTEARSPGLAVGTGKQALLPTKKESASDEEEEMLLLRSLMESSREKEANRNQELPGSSVSRSNLGKVFLVTYSFVGFKFYFFWGGGGQVLVTEPRACFVPNSSLASELYLRPPPPVHMSLCVYPTYAHLPANIEEGIDPLELELEGL